MNTHWRRVFILIALCIGTVASATTDTLAGKQLVEQLRHGGNVLLMRHASSPRTPPEVGAANPDNVNRERQLDEQGRSSASSVGAALKKLGIPIGPVLSSPTYRALETIRYAGVGNARTFDELGDGGQSMQPAAAEARADWLRTKLHEQPPANKNTLIVTHHPNVAAALGDPWSDIAEGEMLVIDPKAKELKVIGRIPVEEWSKLVKP